MSHLDSSPVSTTGRFPNRWALFPIGLLGILVSVQAVLFSLSRNDPSFAVEPDYYQKAVSWDQHAKQLATSARLGWQPSFDVVSADGRASLRLTLVDKDAKPVADAAIGLTTFPNARANLIQTLSPRQVEPGIYEAPIRVAYPGEWEVRLTATRDGTVFEHVARITLTVTP